jgi:hypothetical protein
MSAMLSGWTSLVAALLLAAPTAPQRAEYLAHLRAGRDDARVKLWGEAVKQFEAALKAMPDDPRALAEMGWAAFQAGDSAKARAAETKALGRTADPALRAAALYNLGRIAEAGGDRAAAERHYRDSLALRPSATVEKRLAGLGAPPPKPATPEPPPCATPGPLDALKACLLKAAPEGMDPEYPRTYDLLEKPAAKDLRVAVVRFSMSESEFYLLADGPGGWRTVADLGYLYEGGVAGVSNSMEVTDVDGERLGDAWVVRVSVREDHSDSDLGIDEVESGQDVRVTVCVLSRPGAPGPTCPLTVPTLSTYTRERLGGMDDAQRAEMKDLVTPNLPVHRESRLDLRLAPDGTATVVQVKGTVADRALLGEHRLW